jgi:hypothetical protein
MMFPMLEMTQAVTRMFKYGVVQRGLNLKLCQPVLEDVVTLLSKVPLVLLVVVAQ